MSTEAQAERYGLHAQTVGLKKRAQERGYSIVGIRDEMPLWTMATPEAT